MKAQKITDKFKKNGLLKSASDFFCYKASDNNKVTNLFYKSVEDTIDTKDGYIFVFDDKTSVEFDGKLFIVNDTTQTEYRIQSL